MIRAVFDTNIFVSSLLVETGKPAQALQAWRNRELLLITSPALIEEIVKTLGYKRIRRKYSISDEDVAGLINLLEHDALVVPGDADVAGSVPDDPDDERVLACAIDGRADVVVSGDKHLLDLHTFREIPIVNVHDFLELIRQNDK
jgi:hypothetical protein